MWCYIYFDKPILWFSIASVTFELVSISSRAGEELAATGCGDIDEGGE